MKAIRQILLIVSCFVFLFLFVGCNSIVDNTTSKEKELVCDEHNFKVTLPSGWKDADGLNEAASIQASNLSKDIHFLTIVEFKDAFSDDYTLEDYMQLLVDNHYSVIMENIDIGESIETEIDSLPAIQTVISGEIQKVKLTYLVTFAESQDRFFQVLAWGSQKSYEDHGEELHEITNSLKLN